MCLGWTSPETSIKTDLHGEGCVLPPYPTSMNPGTRQTGEGCSCSCCNCILKVQLINIWVPKTSGIKCDVLFSSYLFLSISTYHQPWYQTSNGCWFSCWNYGNRSPAKYYPTSRISGTKCVSFLHDLYLFIYFSFSLPFIFVFISIQYPFKKTNMAS